MIVFISLQTDLETLELLDQSSEKAERDTQLRVEQAFDKVSVFSVVFVLYCHW